MAPENNNIDATIDALFSDKPAAPGMKPAAPAAQPHPAAPAGRPAQAPVQGRPAAPAQRAAAPAQRPAAQTRQAALTISDLKKALERPQAPVAKEPIWATILLITSMVLSFTVMVLAIVGAVWYFRGAIMSQILCVILGLVIVAFVISAAFMIRTIEQGIREIKSKL